MSVEQAVAALDQADDDLRMAGVSALGMSALYEDPDAQGRKLLVACREWICAMKEWKRTLARRKRHRRRHHRK